MKKLLFILASSMMFSQTGVGINTTTPTATLDVNGTTRLREVPTALTGYSVLVVDADGNVKKVPASTFMQNSTTTCPNFMKSLSNPFYLLFSSSSSIPNPNNPLVINGLNFNSSGSWVQNNVYFYSWTNISGQPFVSGNFSITFGSQTCVYTQ